MATNTARISELLDEAKVWYLATCGDDGQPHARPISFKMVANGHVWFGVGTFKNVYKQLQANPKCEFSAMVGQDFIRYFGTATFSDDPALFEQACEEAPFLKGIYNDETGNKLGMFYLEDATFELRSLFDVKETVEA